MPRTVTKNQQTDYRVLRGILDELRLLRQEISLMLPQEVLREYAHPNRVKRSYLKAFKRYPPATAWK